MKQQHPLLVLNNDSLCLVSLNSTTTISVYLTNIQLIFQVIEKGLTTRFLLLILWSTQKMLRKLLHNLSSFLKLTVSGSSYGHSLSWDSGINEWGDASESGKSCQCPGTHLLSFWDWYFFRINHRP